MGEGKERAVWLANFVMPYEPELRRWFRKYEVPDLEIDDVIQETYAILAGLASVDEIRNPRSYAFQTAHSIIQSHRRRARIVSITPVAEIAAFGISDQPSPESEASGREELQVVDQAIAQLPANVREVFVLRKLEGWPQRKVAEHLGISENVVEKRVASAVKSLLNALRSGGNAEAVPPYRLGQKPEKPATPPVRDRNSSKA